MVQLATLARRSKPEVRARPLRVLELRAAEGAGGGPEKTILQGAAAADPRRFAVTVCYVRPQHDPAFDIDQRATRLGLDYVELRQRGIWDLRVFGQARRLVRERGIDVVHAHDYKTNLLALTLARWEGLAALSTAHGWTGDSWRERHVYYPADKRLLACFPFVLAVSGEIRAELLRHGANPERVQTLLNGIEPSIFRRDSGQRKETRTRLGLADTDIVLGGVGRLSLQKRFDLLLQAFAELRRGWPALRLLIAGEGELRSDLEDEAQRLGLGDACRFLGHVADVRALYAALDVFVQSSDYEGTPNVVLEAMAMEVPVVATTVGGTAELLVEGVHGLLVPPRDEAALATAIAGTLELPEATQARVAAARRRVERELSFAARQAVLEGIYDRFAARQGARRNAPGGHP